MTTYDRNLPITKFHSTGSYNPETKLYYNSSDELLRKDETWRGVTYTQTISGSSYANYTTSYTVTYSSWTETTVS